jgi:hypothetical protein
MLDLYLITDKGTKQHLGGLEEDHFESLKKKGIINMRYDYYKDFTWRLEEIHQMQKNIHLKKLEKDPEVALLLTILFKASAVNGSIVTEAD